MEKAPENFLRHLIIMNELGLHARPAAQIAELAKKAICKVWIARDGEKVDASSIIDILTLACSKGTEIILQIDDQSDVELLDEISELIESGFGE